MKRRWYIGPYRAETHERCYGWISTGYWSYAGYSHDFWGLVWGRWTFGIGLIQEVRR